MIFEAPSFWWKKKGFLSNLLLPVSFIYGRFAARTMKRIAPALNMPVLCVGNLTLGGTGKTPTVIALTQAAKEKGFNPGIVSRGYGAKKQNIHLINLEKDNAENVGDEPYLLSKYTHVAIGSDRFACARALQKVGCDFIIMDDGFQSRRLLPDYSLLVIDGMRGLGNGQVFPSGPLRAPLSDQLVETNGILIIGKSVDPKNSLSSLSTHFNKPVEQATLQPFTQKPLIPNTSFFAFSGIGNPQKFHQSIEQMGGNVACIQNFPDHYFFKDNDLQKIANLCKDRNLIPATTAKDYARILSRNQTAILPSLAVFDITVTFSNTTFCSHLIDKTIESYKQRSEKTEF